MKNLEQYITKFRCLIILIAVFYGHFGYSQVSSEERQALIDLYNATNGAHWTNTKENNMPWLITNTDSPVADWYGVTVENGKIAKLELVANNLIGSVPESLIDLEKISLIDLSGNILDTEVADHLKKLLDNGILKITKADVKENVDVSYITGYNFWKGIPIFTAIPGIVQLTKKHIKENKVENLGIAYSGTPKSSIRTDIEEKVTKKDIDEDKAIDQSITEEDIILWEQEQEDGYTDKEIGFDRKRIKKILKEQGVDPYMIKELIQYEREIYLRQYEELQSLVEKIEEGFLVEKAIKRGYKSDNQLVSQKSTTTCDVPESERLALIALYNSTNGASWSNPWDLTQPVCSWNGITVFGGHITQINLSRRNITGSIPGELGQLTFLTKLDLSVNKLTGNLPGELGQLNNLSELILHSNSITGNIPGQLGQLSSLEKLNLSRNKLGGNIPVELGQLPNLYDLNLSVNSLTGGIPVELGQLAELQVLRLNVNGLTGTIPQQLTQCTKLSILDLGGNSFAGDIPSYIGDFINLTYLSISSNQFTTIPPEIGLLTNLSNLIISYNQIGSLPIELGQLTNLRFLNFQFNNIAVIPEQIGNLTNLLHFSGSFNKISTSLPSFLGTLINLTGVYLNNNEFVGEIPDTYGNLKKLNFLSLGSNKIMGNIPPSIGGCTALKYFHVEKNQLTGGIPDTIGDLQNLTSFLGYENQLSGIIPSSFGNVTNLTVLRLDDNQLEGILPSSLLNLTKLRNVYLNGNKFMGDLPFDKGIQPNISLLHFQNNDFVFSDFEDKYPLYKSGIRNLNYNPQAKVDETETLSVAQGGTITLTSTALTSPNNSYQWYKDGVAISGATSKDLVLSNVTGDDAGIYHFTATNSVVTGLTLERNPITLTIQTINNVQTFCLSDNDEPTIGDLVPPIPDQSPVNWFETETGGETLDPVTLIMETTEFWAEYDPSQPRTKVTAIIDPGITGYDHTELYYQEFSVAANPTVSDLLPQGPDITWYISSEGGIALLGSENLQDQGVYYAEQSSGSCRFKVVVKVGVLIPDGDQWQSFCASQDPTLEDLQGRFTPLTGHTFVWYRSETGPQITDLTEGLIDNTIYYLSQVDSLGNESERIKIEVSVVNIPPPMVFRREQIFYSNDPVTVSQLNAIGTNIIWYNAPTGGSAYRPSDYLVDGQLYYAAQGDFDCITEEDNCCRSTDRIEVLVRIFEEQPPGLIGCERFRPQPGDRYVISGWVREDGLLAVNPVTRDFSEVKQVFVDLLNHLVQDKMLAPIPSDRHIPEVYVPREETREFDVLVPFIANTPDKNLTIYNFEYIKERENNLGSYKTIGFRFAFSPESNAVKFEYKTPKVYFNFDAPYTSYNKEVSYRYPLYHNSEGLSLQFKDAAICGNNICITSAFSFTGNSFEYINNGNTVLTLPADVSFNNQNLVNNNNTISLIQGQITSYTYVSDPYYQVMDYANSLLRLTFTNSEDNVIPLEAIKVVFRPKGAIIDGWQQIIADFTIPMDAVKMKIGLESSLEEDPSAQLNVYFDDIRVHPYEANMKTFVYDPITQRLQSELDENNFATYYEYDQEGGLIRVKKETERGIFTIQETRSGNSKLNNTQE